MFPDKFTFSELQLKSGNKIFFTIIGKCGLKNLKNNDN